jgi:exodeoxyribonuclease-3
MIISRVAVASVGFGDQIGYLPSRAAAVVLPAPGGPLRVIGLYVPSRDADAEKTERKRKWLAACDTTLAAVTAGTPAIVSGDLTDAFRHLHPHDAEYSWVGRTGDGYRYDHAFCSRPLRGLITECLYLHQPRQNKLSDHSALTMRLSLTPSQALPVPDPTAGPNRTPSSNWARPQAPRQHADGSKQSPVVRRVTLLGSLPRWKACHPTSMEAAGARDRGQVPG